MLAAGRYSYSDLALSLTSRAKLDYWDYPTRVTWALGKNDAIGVFAFASHDYLGGASSDGTIQTELDVLFHRVNASLQKEATDVSCSPSGRPGQLDACSPQTVGPISVPSIGLEGSTD